jgi:hypothetical protein
MELLRGFDALTKCVDITLHGRDDAEVLVGSETALDFDPLLEELVSRMLIDFSVDNERRLWSLLILRRYHGDCLTMQTHGPLWSQTQLFSQSLQVLTNSSGRCLAGEKVALSHPVSEGSSQFGRVPSFLVLEKIPVLGIRDLCRDAVQEQLTPLPERPVDA